MDLRPVTDADVAGALLAAAFHDDPATVWWFPDSTERAKRTPAFFAANARLALILGDGLLTKAGDGVALYLPPGAELTDEAVAAARVPEAIGALPDEVQAQVERYFAALGDLHAETITLPHWYPMLIGVHPRAQGRGIGVALVEEVNRRALRDDTPVYLDTITASNVGFYERRGYRVVAECDVPDSPVHAWGMRFN